MNKRTGGARRNDAMLKWVKDTRERLKVDGAHPVVSGWIAAALGALFATGVALLVGAPAWRDMGAFMCMLALYHMWEWSYVALFHRDELSGDSFLINHSVEWVCAWAFALAEYVVEHALWPGMKSRALVMLVGWCVAAAGQGLRTASMWHAGSNFAHLIEDEARPDHELVTTGVYAFSRHPSYLGWFWWTVGMAVLLGNPVTAVGFVLASWYFFKDRIEYEEHTLVDMFGDKYIEYRKRVPVRIPFIN